MPHTEKILIVDDEPRICDSLRNLLTTQGYEIKTCCNGHKALKHLTEDIFDLVLLDVAMEDMDGFQVMEGMARHHLDLPVIIMTGNASTAWAVKALRKGAYDYLRKPFEPEELFTSVKNAFRVSRLKKDNDQVNSKLRESEERYRILAEHSLQGIAVLKGNPPVFVYVNPRWVELFGYAADEALSMGPEEIWNLVHPDDRSMVQQRNRDQLSGKSVVPIYEFRIIRKDGTTRWVEVYANKMEDENGEEALSQAVYVDITERKQAESSLRESETRLRLLSNNLPGGLVYQIDTGEDGSQRQFLFISAGVEQLHGITVSRALDDAMSIYSQIVEEDRHLVAEREALAIANMEPFNVEIRLRLPSGEIRWRLFTSAPRRMPNRHLCWDGIEIDITERKREQKERESLEIQNRQLQKIQSLSRMAGAIAHHFNNKLMAVMGNLELVLGNLPPGNEHFENLSQAMKSAHKASEVSSLMLTYLGQSVDRKEPMDFCEVCRRGLPLIRATLPVTIRLETILPSPPGPVINGNANQILQVLTNLITNASESYDAQGTVYMIVKTVSAKSIPSYHRYPIDWQPQGKTYACLEVTDTGCGITEEDIEKVFDPFFTTKFTGRGLGLAVVLGIMKTHNGAITVESESGRTSIFRAFFPVSTAPVIHEPKKTAPAPAVNGRGSVLLVEDIDSVRKIARSILMRLGFTVFGARDGLEAVEIFRQHRDEIRCVLCDLTMPRMNGWETLAALRKLSPELPVILVSGHDEGQAMAGDHPERPNAFLHKPFSRKELADVMQQTLTKK